MKPTLIKYNPAFLSREELVRSFVVRGVDLELIIETVRENVHSSNQHLLVIGPRGMGKTMLALRVAAYVSGDEELNSAWYPLVFSEESYEVWTAAEFWLQAIFHLGKQTGDRNLVRLHEQLKEERDDKRLYERALACLMDFADEQKKRLLVVVENLNMLLDDQMGPDETWNLRHTLLNEPRIMLMGTATSRFDEIDNSGKAMFELFRIHSLEPLDTMESKRLWESLTGQEVEENRIRPLQILTGGNPRFLAIISSFAVGSSFRELMEHLTSLIDEYTTYFKSNIEGLPSLERKIFVTLANIWEPATAARVARDARIDVNKVSSLLKRLETRGSVGVVKEAGRKKSYQVIERLYNIYHLMRLSGRKTDRVRAVVDFMVNFYQEEELARKVEKLTEDACSLKPEERGDHLEAYKVILQAVQDSKKLEQIIDSTKQDFFQLPDVFESLSQMIKQFQLKIEPSKKPNEQETIIDQKEDTRKSHQKNLLETPEDFRAWLKNELLKRYRELKSRSSKSNVNKIHSLIEEFFGTLYHEKLAKYEEAEAHYRRAFEINLENDGAWANLGRLYHEKLAKYKEAETYYRKAIEINAENDKAWVSLGLLCYYELGKYKDAESAFRKAIKINSENDRGWAGLGLIYHYKLSKYKEAENAFRKAIEINPKYCRYYGELGFLLYKKLGRYEEAEEVFRKGIDIDPEYASVWVHMGCILHEKLERYEEAEEFYRKAIDIDPKHNWAQSQLVKLQIEQSEATSKIFDTISQHLKIANRSPKSLNSIAWVICETDFKAGFSTAESLAQEALEKEPESVYYQHTFAFILGAQGKWEKALEIAAEFLKNPKSAKEFPNDIISFFADAAVAGYAKEGLKLQKSSICAPYLEPLIVALQMLTGEEYNAPQEVVEVAKDVVKRIEEKKTEDRGRKTEDGG